MPNNLKNYGIRFSNVVKPVYNDDKYPITHANDSLGGLHVVRSLREFEKHTQRLLIGMEVVSLNEELASDGKPEYGRWRLKSANIVCNHSTFGCPLWDAYRNNHKCLLEHPKCRVSRFDNCVWERLYDDDPWAIQVDWPTLQKRPWQLLYIAGDQYLPNFYTNNISMTNNRYGIINLIAEDGKIDERLLREYEDIDTWDNLENKPWQLIYIAKDQYLPAIYANNVKMTHPSYGRINLIADDGRIDERLLRDKSKVKFWNDHVLVDHSFFPADKWYGKNEGIPEEVTSITTLNIGKDVQQINLSLLKNLRKLNFDPDCQLNYIRIANSKLEEIDLRIVKDSVEEVILDNNFELRKLVVTTSLYTDEPIKRFPLKRISVKGCKNLREIHVSGSQVQTIDLRGCTNLRRLYADNCQLSSLICQENFLGEFTNDDIHGITRIVPRKTDYYGNIKYDYYINFTKSIHYFFRNHNMTKKALDSVYKSLFASYNNYIICLHVGDSDIERNSNTDIATKKGHLVCFCEDQAF